MRDFKLSILLLVLSLSTGLSAQDKENLSPRELKNLGISADRMNDPYQAIDFYEKYLEAEKDDAMIRYRIAENYRLARDYKNAAENYETAYQLKPEKYSKALYYQAQMQQSLGNYEKAIELNELFRDEYRGAKDAIEMRRLADIAIEGCKLAISDSLRKDAIISHLDKSINKAHIESSPIYRNGKLYYTSLPMDKLEYIPVDKEDVPKRQFYFAEEDINGWRSAGLWEEINFPENSNISSGAFSPDGNSFYFSVCDPVADGKILCKIWKAEKFGSEWTEPQPLSENVNHHYFTSTQPAVGIDHKGREVLYFISDRDGGKGGLDIWYNRYNERKAQFDEARNCGSKINSRGDEYSPFVHPLSNSLFFSSNGHPGYGGLDVFKSTGERSKWVEPTNIGSPINSAVDELYFVLNDDGEKGFFASNRKESVPLKNQHCCDDLYSFVYPGFIRILLNGEIMDMKTGETLKGANVRLYTKDKGTQEEILVKELNIDSSKFDFPLESGQEYVLKVKKKDYLLSEIPILTQGLNKSTDLHIKIKMEEIPFTAMIIENIYYEFDSPELTKDAKNTIDTTIYPIMLNNPEIIAEISSHTDSKGTERYNEHLSQKRAESVVKYLRERWIDRKRLKAKGYGESKPIAKNQHDDGSDNPEGRAKNRRTEFKVIGIQEIEDIEVD